ncbi:hypothetical protein [Kordia sp.]|uniref:hypothetical protein n=1 Tax=Kordia sp. TaxID=1965332 RepID=UPI003D6A33EF
MEDFDYIDSLAKTALSDRTAEPSADGWNMVQQKMKRKKRKRLIIYIVLCGLLCSLGVYVGVNSGATIDANAISNKNTDAKVTSNSNSVLTSSSNSISKVNDASQAGIDTSVTQSESQTKNQHQTTNNIHGEKNGILQTKAGVNSQINITKRNDSTNASNVSTKSTNGNKLGNETDITFADGEEEVFYLNAAGLKIYPWELIAPEKLKKKRRKKKKKKSKKVKEVYENLDLMVGFNGFVESNDYNFIGSYVFELSYTKENKLKKNYEFNYGASMQFRNLRFKNDTLSFNRGELSVNVHSSLEKRYGNFGIEAGGYLGYELYSPNNDFFSENDINLFERKVNYGLFSILHYKKVGLVFKYEFSPYINYVGDKKFGAFTIGVKYDF